ncbi:MAG: TSUP family transporter [Eubacteriales bacterium]|nr:TSUP family transporter [Eubacteriales bacterium]
MLTKLLVICPLVFLGGFIDAIAGGGGLITLPAYMLVGLPVHSCIATNKISSGMGTGMAAYKYARAGFIQWKKALPCVIMALFGSAIGANIALHVSDRYFRIFMLIALPVVAFYVLKTKNFSEPKEKYSDGVTIIIGCLIAFFIGGYDGFFGPGTGTFMILCFTAITHLDVTEANGITKAINFASNMSALVVFLMSGKVIIPLGLIAGCFNMLGNYIGASLFQKEQARLVRPFMLVVLVIFFIKLLTELV